MGYKVEHEDEHTFTIKHPDGSHFAIAKHLLDKNTLARIGALKEPVKMSEGGEVEEDAADAEAGIPVEQPIDIEAKLAEPTQISTPAPEAGSIVPGGIEGAAVQSAKPVSAGEGIPYAGQNADMEKIYGQKESAIKLGQKATEDFSKTQADIYGTQNNRLADIAAQEDAAFQDMDKEDKRLTKEYGDGKIDPNRVWGNSGTANKIAAGISVLLGGIGSGLAGGPNQALQVINSIIDRDIDAQKVGLGKTANMLALNMKKYQNKMMALSAAKMEALSSVETQVKQAAAKAQGTQAGANAQLALSAIAQEKMALKMSMARQQVMGQLATGGAQGTINPEVLGKDKDRLVQTDDGYRLAPTAKDAAEIKDAQTIHAALQSKIKHAIELSKEGPTMVFTEAGHAAKHAQEDILMSLRALYDSKRFNEHEFKMFENMVPHPGDFRSGMVAKDLGRLLESVNGKMNSVYASKLMNYNPGEIHKGKAKAK